MSPFPFMSPPFQIHQRLPRFCLPHGADDGVTVMTAWCLSIYSARSHRRPWGAELHSFWRESSNGAARTLDVLQRPAEGYRLESSSAEEEINRTLEGVCHSNREMQSNNESVTFIKTNGGWNVFWKKVTFLAWFVFQRSSRSRSLFFIGFF